MDGSFYRRFGGWILLAAAASLPLAYFGARRAIENNSNRVRDWLPPTFDETQRLDWFIEHFGRDEILLVSWPGCTLENPACDRLAEALLEPAPTPRGGRVRLFAEARTGRSMLRRLTGQPLELTEEEALQRMQGWILGPDWETTCVLATVTPAGAKNRHAAIDWVYDRAEETVGIDRRELRVAGPTLDSVAIDRVSLRYTRVLSAICWGVVLAVACATLRSVRIGALTFGVALLCQFIAVSLLWLTGTPMSAVLLLVGSLVFVLTVSATVHLVNYYRDAVSEEGLEGAATRAVRYAWRPCTLAAGTTALGLVSLTVSQIVPIRRFGAFASLGVLIGLGVMLLVVPAWLERWPPKGWAPSGSRGPVPGAAPDGGGWRRWALAVIRWRTPIALAGLAVLLVCGYGLTRVRTSVNLHNLFRPGARVLEDYDWIQRHVGALIPMEVVLRFASVAPDETPEKTLERMELLQRARRRIERLPHVGATISANTFAPDIPPDTPLRRPRRARLANELRDARERFADAGFLASEGEGELWRIAVRVQARTDLDYGAFLVDVARHVDPLLAEAEDQVDAVYCGGVPLVNQAQKQLLADLFWSFVTAFGLVAVTMAVVLRSVVAGVVSMIPNLLPSVAVFGGMGLAASVVDIGAMMTASAALGIAVDDTLHFLTWFRRGLARGDTRVQAILRAYQRCGRAMIQTTLICGLGLLVYAVSPFVPTSRFAWLMGSLLLTAVLADITVLPALLAGPLGRFFESRARPPESRKQSESAEEPERIGVN